MSKFNLTKQMKAKLALELTVLAVKTTHELAPIDQINRVREMLKAGVPQPEVRVC